MAKKTSEIELDLGKDALYGWQSHYCPLNIILLRRARELGYELPNVNVVKVGEISGCPIIRKI